MRTPRLGKLGNGLLLWQHGQLFPLILVAQAASPLAAHSPADLPVLPSHTACSQMPQTLSNCLSEAAAFAGTLLRLWGRGLDAPSQKQLAKSGGDSGQLRRFWTLVSALLGGQFSYQTHLNQILSVKAISLETRGFEMISD